ncbi:hypothetical protein ACVWWO_003384 [Bradyrhizobium sp. F1.13.1]
MIAIAIRRMMSKPIATLRGVGRERDWATGEGRIKAARCGRSVVGRNCIDFNDPENIANGRHNLRFAATPRCCSVFDTFRGAR